MKQPSLLIGLTAAAAMITACSSSGNSGPRTPDEFRIVTKAPLSVPPEYNLRPPKAGLAMPAEVNADSTGRVAAFGTTFGADASAAERALVAAADANAVNPVIRAQIDYEEAGVIRKSTSSSERIMSWQGDEDTPRGDTATGNEPVVIDSQQEGERIKLPGT